MMKGTRLVPIVLLAGLIGVWIMMRNRSSHEPSSQPQPEPSLPSQVRSTPPGSAPDLPRQEPRVGGQALEPFTLFQARKVSLPFTFEYPAAWVAAEEDGRGAAYQQVLILGPRNTSDTYTAGLTIRVMPTQAAGGKYAALEDLVQWRRAQHARAQALTSLRDGPTQVLGLPGAELEFQFQATVPPGGAPHGATQMTLKTHTVLVAHDERLYEFAFSADAADYDRYHPAFDRLLHTLHLTR